MILSRLVLAMLCVALSLTASSANKLTTSPFWHGSNFDLIYDALWVQLPTTKAHLNDDDLLVVLGSDVHKDEVPNGLRFVTGPDWERYASGQTVRVMLNIKSASTDLLQYQVMYATNDVGSSSWKKGIAGPAFSAFSFDYKVPPMQRGNKDFVFIHFDANADPKRGIVVEKASLALVDTAE